MASRELAYNLFLCNSDDSRRREDQALDALVGVVDGLILAPAIESDHRRPASCATGVRLCSSTATSRNRSIATRCSPTTLAPKQAARYLAEIGHKRIGVISGPLTSTPGRMRHDGFIEGLTESDIEMDELNIYIGSFQRWAATSE